MDFQADGPFLVAQLEAIVGVHPPGETIRAIYFGLIETERGPTLYVSGSTRDPDEANWAGWDADSWLPENRYFQLPSLATADPADWIGIQEGVAVLLRAHEADLARLLGAPGGRPIALGWDEGEPETLLVALQRPWLYNLRTSEADSARS